MNTGFQSSQFVFQVTFPFSRYRSIFRQRSETFDFRVDNLAPGQHIQQFGLCGGQQLVGNADLKQRRVGVHRLPNPYVDSLDDASYWRRNGKLALAVHLDNFARVGLDFPVIVDGDRLQLQPQVCHGLRRQGDHILFVMVVIRFRIRHMVVIRISVRCAKQIGIHQQSGTPASREGDDDDRDMRQDSTILSGHGYSTRSGEGYRDLVSLG